MLSLFPPIPWTGWIPIGKNEKRIKSKDFFVCPLVQQPPPRSIRPIGRWFSSYIKYSGGFLCFSDLEELLNDGSHSVNVDGHQR